MSLRDLAPGTHRKHVIANLSEGLLKHYHGRPLIDPYAIYQHLMDYWAETMQDDFYLIAADGWKAETSRVIETKPAEDKWLPLLGVEPDGFYVQRMRTRWGSCKPAARTIRLNTDLAKKPRECLECIIVHKFVNMIEPTHNAGFLALMDKYMPRWQDHRGSRDRLPVRHEEWGY